MRDRRFSIARPATPWALIIILLAASSPVSSAQVDPWPYLPNDDIGARDFKAAHPTFDGRGVVIAVLDTGVDAFAPGLTETSTGETKLIEVRDFSREGDWKVTEAELADDSAPEQPVFVHPEGLRLRGAEKLAIVPVTDDPVQWPVYLGIIPEQRFLNSEDIQDLNDDGDRDDRFGFLVYLADRSSVEAALGVGRGYEKLMNLNETAQQTVAKERASGKVWVVVVDTDGDGDLAAEAPLRDYRVNLDTFRLTSSHAPEARTLMAWAVNVRPSQDQLERIQPPTVEFHFDNGAHGSHCAGIAAGYRVSGQQGLDGVASGAWLMSLKIGDNRLSGGATTTEAKKKAYEYAASFAEKYDIPVVINMSYGIASVEEGEDTLGKFLNDLLAEHPTLYVCTSAGNAGPGLSTVGLPATAYSLISSGAYLSVATGGALYNAQLSQPTLFAFSSRGGETCKPDVVSPGSALSTVPGYVDGSARFNGTSMASPQTAGAVACLVGAAQQEGLEIHWGMIKRALIAGASRVPGLSLNDQGGGLVNLAATWENLQKLSRSESAHELLWYRIETDCPFQADGMAEAAYWRTPGGTPLKPETVTFTVHPVFHPDLSPDAKDTFYRSFRFRSEADWLKVISGKRYIRGDMGMTVSLQYDGKKMQEAGTYAARVIAELDGGDLSGLPGREFYLWNTVVVGDPLTAENEYKLVYEGRDLPPSWVQRHYVEVPAAASALRVRLEVSDRIGAKRGARVMTEICDPEGHVQGGFAGYATPDDDQIKDMTVLAPDLVPGIWEINVVTSIMARDPSHYRLTVACDGYVSEPATIRELVRQGSGKAATADLTLTRGFRGVFQGTATARIEGFTCEQAVEISESDTWTYDFSLDRQTPRAVFHLEMDEPTANLFTDCAVNILDASGRAVDSGGFDGTAADLSVSLPDHEDAGDYTLQVVGGFALKEDTQDWGFRLEEKYLLAHAISGEVSSKGGAPLHLYCGVPHPLELSFAEIWPAAPEGLHIFGSVRFRDENTSDRAPGDEGGRLVLEVPINLE